MNSFLSVAQGSAEPPVFLEVQYRGAQSQDKHAALVGKGQHNELICAQVYKSSFIKCTQRIYQMGYMLKDIKLLKMETLYTKKTSICRC